MKKKQLTTNLRPEKKEELSERAKEKGLSIGQFIEWLLDKVKR